MAGIQDLASDFANHFSVPKSQGKAAVQYVFESIVTHLTQNDDVAIRGFGVFKSKPMKARTIKNPITKEVVDLPESIRVLFTPGADLKAKVRARLTEDADQAEQPENLAGSED